MHAAQYKILVFPNVISDINIHALEIPALHRHGTRTYMPINVYLPYRTFSIEMLSLPTELLLPLPPAHAPTST